MPLYLNIVIIFSILFLSIYLLKSDFKNKSYKLSIVHFIVIVLIIFILNRFYNFLGINFVAKASNSSHEVLMLLILFVIMIIGMLSSYFFKHFSTKKHLRKSIDFGVFIAPIFISPLIFIPLIDVFQSIDTPKTRIMVYFIAFQNGFLWREYYESKRIKKTNKD